MRFTYKYNKMPQRHPPDSGDEGFTLVEFSIVLVVVGLVVGGILVGKDLIHAAELRATISQIEKYDAAVNAFTLKYNALPGDMRPSDAAAFGFATRTGAAGHGDANGSVTYCDGSFGYGLTGCENSLFWHDLSDAQMIDGSFQGTDATVVSVTGGQLDAYLPPTRIGRGNRITILGNPLAPNRNLYYIYAIDSIDNTGLEAPRSALSPMEAFSIDQKIDDGVSYAGHVRFSVASGGGFSLWPVAPNVGVPPCTTLSGGVNVYDTLTAATAEAMSCALYVRPSW